MCARRWLRCQISSHKCRRWGCLRHPCGSPRLRRRSHRLGSSSHIPHLQATEGAGLCETAEARRVASVLFCQHFSLEVAAFLRHSLFLEPFLHHIKPPNSQTRKHSNVSPWQMCWCPPNGRSCRIDSLIEPCVSSRCCHSRLPQVVTHRSRHLLLQ